MSKTAGRRRHVRATPQPFTILANQTVHVDMAIDTVFVNFRAGCLSPTRLRATNA
jgi:hypothetical protein